MKAHFSHLAAAEMRSIVAWYNREKHGLGQDFRREVNTTILDILELPERWAIYHRDVRRAMVSRYPYLILYHCEDNLIRVLRVVHASGDPLQIRDTLP